MSKISEIIIVIGVILGVLGIGYVIYREENNKLAQTALSAQVIQQQALLDGIVRSSSTYASKQDIDNLAAANQVDLQTIQDNISKLNATLSAINVVSSNSVAQNGTNQPSSSQTPNPTPTANLPDDPYSYQKNIQNLNLSEDFPDKTQVPIGAVSFDASKPAPWNTKIYARQYTASNVIAVDENQRQIVYNKLSITTNGQSYTIPITTATTIQQTPTASFSFNTKLIMGLDGQVNANRVQGEVNPNIGVSFFSYGQYKTSPDFLIGEASVGYSAINKTGNLTITPIAWNVGKAALPNLMSNTYIAPGLSINTDGTLAAGLGLRIEF